MVFYLFVSYRIQLILCLFAMFVCAMAKPATILAPADTFNTAIVQNERIGGNFAYSTVEGPAFHAVSPVLRNYVRPVAVLQQRIGPEPTFYYAPQQQYYGGGFAYSSEQLLV